MQVLADFVMGYQIDSPTDSHHRSWNEGVAVAASQFLDPQDNRPVIEALKKYAAPAAIEQARPQTPAPFTFPDLNSIPYGHWFLLDSPDCTSRYSVQERTDSGCSIVCSTPYTHEWAKKDLEKIVELYNATLKPSAAAEPAPERTPPRIVTDVFHFRNGMLAVCDQHGQQITELQGKATEVLQRLLDLSTRAVAVPEPAAQQESVDLLMFKIYNALAYAEFLTPIGDRRRRVYDLLEPILTARQAEPAPTPSLRKFVQHLPNCRVLHPIRDPEFGDSDCSCGLKKALAGAKEE